MKIDNSSFISKMVNYGANAVGSVTRTKPIKWLGDQFQKNPEKALAYTTGASIVIKDGVGCFKYVSQSLNNKEIPDERRNFVAAMDLSNGLLMILAQIGMFFAMRKYSGPIFDKLFKKSFNPKALENLAAKLRNEDHSIRKLVFNKEAEKVRKESLDLFKFVVDIAAATIIGKRIIVPFVATPVANVVKDKMDKITKEEEIDDSDDNDKIEKEDYNEQIEENTKTKEADDDDDDDDD